MTRAAPLGAAAGSLAATSVLCFVVVGLLGPSIAQPRLAAPGEVQHAPPLHLGLDPDPWLVVGLQVAGYLLATAAVLAVLLALARGWCPPARRVLAAAAVGVAALVVVPPTGSADPLSYAAYGRIAALGDDPYVEAPDAWRGGTDPVAASVPEPWREVPSVYGPLATGEQALAAVLGDGSPARTVWWLGVLGGLAHLAAGALLVQAAGSDRAARARAALLYAANPLVLALGVGGGHLDALAVAPVAAGLLLLRRSPLAAGALLGAAAATKAPLALFGLAAAWGLRHDPRALVRLAAGGVLVVVPSYAAAGPHVLDQLRQASRFVSLATVWHPVAEVLDPALRWTQSRKLIGLLAAVLALALVVALARLLPPPRRDGLHGEAPEPRDPLQATARAAVVLVGAWLLAAPYSLPWYDLALWAPLVLLAPSALDLVALTRTATMALAYVPGLVDLPPDVEGPTLFWRSAVTPWLQVLIVAAVLLWPLLWRRHRTGSAGAPDAGRPPPRRAAAR